MSTDFFFYFWKYFGRVGKYIHVLYSVSILFPLYADITWKLAIQFSINYYFTEHL